MKRVVLSIAALVLISPAGWAAGTDGGESAAQLYEAGKYAQAEAKYAAAVRTAETQAVSQARGLAEALLGLGRALMAQKRYGEAVATFERAQKLCEAIDVGRALTDQIRSASIEAHQQPAGFATGFGGPPPPPPPPPPMPPPPMPPTVLDSRHGWPMQWSHPTYNAGMLATERGLKEMLDDAEKSDGPNSILALNKALDLAEFYVQARDPNQALNFIERVTNALGTLSAERKQDLVPRLVSTIGSIVSFRQYASRAASALHTILPLLSASVMTSDLQSKLSRTAQAFGNAQMMDEAEEINKLLVRYAEKAPSPEGLELARRRLQLARLYERQGNAGKAIELFELGLAAEEKVPEAVRDVVSSDIALLAEAYLKSGSNARAKAQVARFISAWTNERTRGESRPSRILTLATTYAKYKDFPSAQTLYSFALTPKTGGNSRSSDWHMENEVRELAKVLDTYQQTALTARLWNDYTAYASSVSPTAEWQVNALAEQATYYAESGDTERANSAAERAFSALEKQGCSTQRASNVEQMANRFATAGAQEQAAKLLSRLIDFETGCPALKPLASRTLRTLCAVHLHDGDSTKLNLLLNRWLKLNLELLPEQPPELREATKAVTEMTINKGKTELAFETLSSIHLHMLATGDRFETRNITEYLGKLAEIAAKLGDAERAESLMKFAYDSQVKAYGPEHSQTAVTLSQYAAVYRALGRETDAVAMQEHARAIREQQQQQRRYH